MSNFKQKLIIVEGTRGSGKSTITSWLREIVPYSQLIRLSGTADKSKTGKEKVFKARMNDFMFAENVIGCDLHTIMDRSFISEHVYADLLNYKEYSFDKETIVLARKLNNLQYDEMYLVNLFVNNEDVLTERLKRDKSDYQDLKFSKEESLKQQEAYLKAINDLKPLLPNVKIVNFDTSKDLENNKNELKKLLNL